MKIILECGNYLEAKLPCGTKFKASKSAEKILRDFPSWRFSGGYVKVCRYLKTEYGSAKEEYFLHKLIAKPPKSLQVDHINGDKMDNREENLRWATSSENGINKKTKTNTGYRGVNYHPKANPKKPYRAYLRKNKKTYYLGWFKTPEEAAEAYNAAAIKIHGRFAMLNAVAH